MKSDPSSHPIDQAVATVSRSLIDPMAGLASSSVSVPCWPELVRTGTHGHVRTVLRCEAAAIWARVEARWIALHMGAARAGVSLAPHRQASKGCGDARG
jgi:hypothetical protein